jgi:hypothetical protein
MKVDWTATRREAVVTKRRLRIRGHQHAGAEAKEQGCVLTLGSMGDRFLPERL